LSTQADEIHWHANGVSSSQVSNGATLPVGIVELVRSFEIFRLIGFGRRSFLRKKMRKPLINQEKRETFRHDLIVTIIDKLLIALILIGAGLWANQNLEVFKSRQARHSEVVSAKIEFIQSQLSEFYWPLLFRLEKDNAVWTRIMNPEKRLAANIEEKFILPNHDEILQLLDSKSYLMFNSTEKIQGLLIDAIKQYERHIAVYKALKSIGDTRRPADLGENWPKNFDQIIRIRIVELERQREALLAE
jgi:hypothetical protein